MSTLHEIQSLEETLELSTVESTFVYINSLYIDSCYSLIRRSTAI